MQVCLKGTLFTPLSKKNTSTQSLNVQLRKDLGLGVNLVHGFSLPNVPVRHEDLDIVVIRCVHCCYAFDQQSIDGCPMDATMLSNIWGTLW